MTSQIIPRALLAGAALLACAQPLAADREEADAIVNQPAGGAEVPEDAITITAEKEARFDSNERIAIFIGKVAVDDQRFYMTCDRLTVYLNEEGGGMKRAEADGNVNILQKSGGSEDGEPSRGRSQRAIYRPDAGTVTLIGAPEVQQGINLHKASQYDTRMTLNPDGQLQTDGPSRTFIQDREAAQ